MARDGYDLILGDDLPLLGYEGPNFTIDVLADDAEFGNADPVVGTIENALLSDGTLTYSDRDDNATSAFTLEYTAATAQGLADAERLVEDRLRSIPTLTWQVPFGAPTVFEPRRAWTTFLTDDFSEVAHGKRRFRLNLDRLPYGRSLEPRTFTWTGPTTQVHDLADTTGWTFSGGTGESFLYTTGVNGIRKTTTGTLTFSRSVLMRDYLRLVTSGGSVEDRRLTAVSVAGVPIPQERIGWRRGGGTTHTYTIDTSAWRGQTATVQFTIAPMSGSSDNRASLLRIHTMDYPDAANEVTPPRTLGIVEVEGTARTGCHISFTAPAGGAFVYTAPDPNVALRERGAGETVFSNFTVSDPAGGEVAIGSRAMWFPQGTHATTIGFSDPQPLALHPDGVWPQHGLGSARWAFPSDRLAATSFFSTSGAKNVISPSPELPTGYHGGAQAHEAHVLHPGRCGFGVWDINGDPITATVTYYPRWKHHAAS